MTFNICIEPGPIAIHFTWLVLTVSIAALAFFAGRLKSDRAWELDVRRRVAQSVDAPWFFPGEPVAVNRIDAEISIFKRRPYRQEGFDPIQWAA